MRTIFLEQTISNDWRIRVGAGAGLETVSEDTYENVPLAIRSFVVEGRHQPSASMVVIVEGKAPTVVRAGGPVLIDSESEAELIFKIREALR